MCVHTPSCSFRLVRSVKCKTPKKCTGTAEVGGGLGRVGAPKIFQTPSIEVQLPKTQIHIHNNTNPDN